MAYTFLRAQGKPVGTSLVEAEREDDARRVLAVAKETGHELLLPIDHVVARKLEAGAEHKTVAEIPDGWMGVDIGPATARLYAERAARARTIFWNGPMGVFEIDAFAKGTEALAHAVAASAAASVVGGGDSLAAVNRVGVGDRITHLSTGGGASLEFVEGRTLPGVAALETAR
jgi:phosphoglycerate kinase